MTKIKVSSLKFTTGDPPPFAVCQGHTVKPQKPTANLLPCAAHDKAHTATRDRQSRPLPCAIYRAHGKGFAVCNYQPMAKKSCHPGMMTWLGLCRVPCWRGTRQSSNLCRVPRFLHTENIGTFAVCKNHGIRQRFELCRVPRQQGTRQKLATPSFLAGYFILPWVESGTRQILCRVPDI